MCHEPLTIEKLQSHQQACQIFQDVGWMTYFERFQGFDEQTTLEFVLNLDEEGESSHVRGLRVSASEETIASVSGLSRIEQRWFNRKTAMSEFLEEFLVGDETVRTNRKGYDCVALPQPWDDVALFI